MAVRKGERCDARFGVFSSKAFCDRRSGHDGEHAGTMAGGGRAHWPTRELMAARRSADSRRLAMAGRRDDGATNPVALFACWATVAGGALAVLAGSTLAELVGKGVVA